MVDHAHMSSKRHDEPMLNGHSSRFADMAREELRFTANAFFAPLVGTVRVICGLLEETRGEDKPENPDKRDAA
jgi:hypothetical protein